MGGRTRYVDAFPRRSSLTGINVVREMMGDQAAAKLSASADSNTFGAPIAAYAVDQVFADI